MHNKTFTQLERVDSLLPREELKVAERPIAWLNNIPIQPIRPATNHI